MKRVQLIFIAICAVVFAANYTTASEKATLLEVYDMVIKGSYLLENLGEKGLAAFNEVGGEMAWKDAYVQVYNCQERQIQGHPDPKVRAYTKEEFWELKDSKGMFINQEICNTAEKASGSWVEYYWMKQGETKPSRKIMYVIQVLNTPWQVSAGIYDDIMSLKDLNGK